MEIYRTKENETIYDIASEYGISPIKLAIDNEIENMERLARGRELLVRRPTRTYTVKKGDTAAGIALRFGINEEAMRRENPELTGRALYPGQCLYLKSAPPKYGMAVGIGYLFRGYTERKLRRAMPYLSYLFISSAVSDGGTLKLLFSDTEAIAAAKSSGKIPILRIYSKNKNAKADEIIDGAIIMARGHGYNGICFAGFNTDEESGVKTKRKLMEYDLYFFTEGELSECKCTDYADGTVLCYDKLHKKPIPSFASGEEGAMREYSERCLTDTAFIELSAFALANGKYIEKTKAVNNADRSRDYIEYKVDEKILEGYRRRGRKDISFVLESLENTKSKLELIFELGFMGIAFDVERTPLAELLLFGELFATPKSTKDRAVCNPKD